mgnify:CR=1 FL=1
MSSGLKRILVIVGFFGIIALVAWMIYFVFFRAPSAPVTTPPSVEGDIQSGTTGLPGSGTGTIPTGGAPSETTLPPSEVAAGGATASTQLTSSAIISPVITADGKSMAYYDPSDGRFYKINNDGTVTRLSDKQFPDAETIVWDDSATTVAIEFPDGANIIFNFTTEKQTSLPTHWEDFDFSPAGDQVIAKSIGNDPSARALVITNADGSNTQIINGLGKNADLVDVAWSPNDQVIAFADTASGTGLGGIGRQMIFPIGKNEENFKGLVVEGLNFHARWSPNGAQILYDAAGASSNYRPLLWIVDGTAKTMGDNRMSLGLNTWVEKCTFADDTTIYCAVPSQMDNNAGLQPDTVTSDDSIYRVDLTTGKVKLIGYPAEGTPMLNLAVSADGNYLYFTDDRNRLQSMRIK